MYKKVVRKLYQNINIKYSLENKTFWKNVKSLFPEASMSKKKFTIVKRKTILSEDVAEEFNTFFKDAVKNLDICINNDLLNNIVEVDPVEYGILKFEFHVDIEKGTVPKCT